MTREERDKAVAEWQEKRRLWREKWKSIGEEPPGNWDYGSKTFFEED